MGRSNRLAVNSHQPLFISMSMSHNDTCMLARPPPSSEVRRSMHLLKLYRIQRMLCCCFAFIMNLLSTNFCCQLHNALRELGVPCQVCGFGSPEPSAKPGYQLYRESGKLQTLVSCIPGACEGGVANTCSRGNACIMSMRSHEGERKLNCNKHCGL